MKDIFILGATKYSFMIQRFIEQEKQYRVLGYTVNEAYICLLYTNEAADE